MAGLGYSDASVEYGIQPLGDMTVTEQTAVVDYIHIRLPSKNHTRILELEPAIDSAEPLHCRLRDFDLSNDELTYEVLSYTWGAPAFPETLFIDGVVMHISTNLSVALRHFRLSGSIRRIWVDAVCINQRDDDEKNLQIPLMSGIYCGANRVLVWLGNSKEGEKAIARLNALDRHVSDRRKRRPQAVVDASSAVARVLSLPWFNRRWIIQESVLNPDTLLFCGSAQISWLRFNIIVQAALSGEATEIRGSQAVMSLTAMFDLWKNWALTIPQADQCRMVRLLQVFHYFDCGDSRDRIYAFLGLASDIRTANQLVSEPETSFERPSLETSRNEALASRDREPEKLVVSPDYEASTEEVYSRFALTAIREQNLLLWLLQQSVAREKESGMPSWVPDFRHPLRCHPLWSDYTIWRPSKVESLPGCRALFLCDAKLHFTKVQDSQTSRQARLAKLSETVSRGGDGGDLIGGVENCEYIVDFAPLRVNWVSEVYTLTSTNKEVVMAWVKKAFEDICEHTTTASRERLNPYQRKNILTSFACALIANARFTEDLSPAARDTLIRLAIPESKNFTKTSNSPVRSNWLSDPAAEELDAQRDGICRAFTDVLWHQFEDPSPRESDITPFIGLMEMTLKERCVFTCDLDSKPSTSSPEEIIGVGSWQVKHGNRILSPCYTEDGLVGPCKCLWNRTFLVREIGIATRLKESQCLDGLSGADEELVFEIVGDCFLAKPQSYFDRGLQGRKTLTYIYGFSPYEKYVFDGHEVHSVHDLESRSGIVSLIIQ